MVCLQVFWSVGEEQMFGEELNTRGTPECGHRMTDYDRLRNYAGISCDKNQVRLKGSLVTTIVMSLVMSLFSSQESSLVMSLWCVTVVSSQSLWFNTQAHAHTHTHAHIYAHTYAHTHTHTQTFVCTCMHE